MQESVLYIIKNVIKNKITIQHLFSEKIKTKSRKNYKMYLYYSIHVMYLPSYTERTKIAIVRTAFPGTGPRQSQNETEVKLKKFTSKSHWFAVLVLLIPSLYIYIYIGTHIYIRLFTMRLYHTYDIYVQVLFQCLCVCI